MAALAAAEIVEVQDNDSNISALSSKTTSKAQTDVAVGNRIATGFNHSNGPAANSTQPGTASEGSKHPIGADPASGAAGGPGGKWSYPIPLLHPQEGRLYKRKADR